MICFSCTRAKSLAFFFRALLRSVIPVLFIFLSSVYLTIRHICGTNIPHVSERTGVKSRDSFELFASTFHSRSPLFPHVAFLEWLRVSVFSFLCRSIKEMGSHRSLYIASLCVYTGSFYYIRTRGKCLKLATSKRSNFRWYIDWCLYNRAFRVSPDYISKS